jgi:4-amino-4-deoxy-L-arabinose transferase-like glycosyltransferase
MKGRIYWLLLGAVLLLFLVTRLFQIAGTPSSVYWDEASIGYNAYSILRTGADEWGKSFPIHFRAFGEFKLPVYIYSVAVAEELFGLSSFAVRFPAVIFSALTLILVFLLGQKLTNRKSVGIVAAGVFSVMPWSFMFSRAGFEASAGLMFFCLGFLLLLYADKKRWLVLVSALGFILSFYSYNSYRIISPLAFVILGFFLYKTEWKKYLIFFILGVLIILISFVPIVRLILYDAGFSRGESFSLIPNIQQVYDLSHQPHLQIIYDRSKKGDWWGNFFAVCKNFLSHLSIQFLFLNGDGNPRDGQSGFGELYFIDGIFLIWGLILAVKKRFKFLWLPVTVILLSFVPPSLFKESPHALRSLSAAPFFAILIAYGIVNTEKYLKKIFWIIPVIYLAFFANYYFSFLSNYNTKYSHDWQYGYKQIFTDYQNQFSKYQRVYISDNDAQPYIFGLFYDKIDPKTFIATKQLNDVSDWGFSTVRSFDKFVFIKDKEIANIKERDVLIFASPEGAQTDRVPSGEIKLPNGQTAFYVYSQ